MMVFFVHAIVSLLLLPLVFAVGYLILLTMAAFRAPRNTSAEYDQPITRFLFLVPAHNEERLLPATLKSLNAIDYPKELFNIHVVADNCTDRTAAAAADHGAIVHVRTNDTLRGKGYALQWLLDRLWQAEVPQDAVIILDADTVVSRNFLQVMDSRIRQGQRIIQAYYAVRDPGRSWGISLRYAALAVLHYLRPQGRMVLGGSTGLKGNGMVFHPDILRSQGWTASLTEDIEFHMSQVLAGERVFFAPDAVVWAEMPENLSDANTQNERWERGRLQMASQFVPRLLKEVVAQRPINGRFLLFDAAMEHMIPPFSILMGGSVAAAAAAVVAFLAFSGSWGAVNLALAAAIVTGQIIYLISGLRMAQAPPSVYRALIYAPGFMLWKIWLYFKLLITRSDDSWIRTARNQ